MKMASEVELFPLQDNKTSPIMNLKVNQYHANISEYVFKNLGKNKIKIWKILSS